MSEFFHNADIVESGKTHRASSRKAHRRKKRIRTSIVLFFSVAIIVLAIVIAVPHLKGLISKPEIADYPGPGTGSVVVTIPEGAIGSDIAKVLYDNGVVASSQAFINAFNEDPRAASIQAGSYQLMEEMSAKGAISALLDPASKAITRVTIPEGFTKQQVVERLANIFETDVTEVEAVLKDPDSFGLPAEAKGSIEGWISPLTYDFQPGDTVTDALTTMVKKRVDELNSLGISRDKWLRTLTVASIVEREVNWPDHYAQVARVIENRLVDTKQVNGRLQMDSTVLYGIGKTGGVPTKAELETDSPYNTYIHPGLPPTPISSPSIDAIKAASAPPAGDWLYFVTVNFDTGETKFAKTLEEHNKNVEELRQWAATRNSDDN